MSRDEHLVKGLTGLLSLMVVEVSQRGSTEDYEAYHSSRSSKKRSSDGEDLVTADVVQIEIDAATMELYATPQTHQKSMATAHNVLRQSRIYDHGRCSRSTRLVETLL